MKRIRSTTLPLIAFALALAALAVFFFDRIFGNICIDPDTLNYVIDLDSKSGTLDVFSSFAVSGWFSKFHILLFPLVYLVTKAYAPFGGMDFLMGFKIVTYVSVLLTFSLIFYTARRLMSNLWITLLISIAPFLTLGPCWLISTCDDNGVAALFELLFLMSVLLGAGELVKGWSKRHPFPAAWIIGLAASLSLAIHMKGIVALPLVLTPLFVSDMPVKTRVKMLAHTMLCMAIVFGGLFGIYWFQSVSETVQSKTDFYVFHRVPGIFFFTEGTRQTFSMQMGYVYAGIRTCLYAQQDMFHTNFLDGDILSHLLVAILFLLYLISAILTRKRRATKILFFFFVLHLLHSTFYDSWVNERWDLMVYPIFLTIGMWWDKVIADRVGKLIAVRKAVVSLVATLMVSLLVWANLHHTGLLMEITANRRSAQPSRKKWLFPPYISTFYNHHDLYRLARDFDRYFDDKSYFLALDLTQPRPPPLIDKYLTLYSEKYRTRKITHPLAIEGLVSSGRMETLLFIDSIHIPFVYPPTRNPILINPGLIETVYEDNQLSVKKATFQRPVPPGG